MTIYWIQAQCILLLGEQVLTIFICIKRVRYNWNFIVYDVQNATYSSHGVPCLARDLYPWLNTSICMGITQISERTFFVPLGFGGYLLTIELSGTENAIGLGLSRKKSSRNLNFAPGVYRYAHKGLIYNDPIFHKKIPVILEIRKVKYSGWPYFAYGPYW